MLFFCNSINFLVFFLSFLLDDGGKVKRHCPSQREALRGSSRSVLLYMTGKRPRACLSFSAIWWETEKFPVITSGTTSEHSSTSISSELKTL